MAVLIATKARRPRRETANTYGLPRGESIRREMRDVFARQRKKLLNFLRTGRKELRDPTPDTWPEWDDFGLGAIDIAHRMTPLLQLIWEAAAAKFAPRVGLDPNEWDVVNPYTERLINDAALAFAESTNETTSLELDEALRRTREELQAGIVDAGEALPKLTDRVNAIFDTAEKWRARRIAQTETSRAVHSAQEQAAIASGVVRGWKWLASSDACPLCLTIARRAAFVKLGQPFAVIGDHPIYSTVKFPPAHPHCCLPETPVVAPMRVKGMVAQYDGPIVRLYFSDGSDVSVTPNHMLLTPDGFAPAGSLIEGDDILHCRPLDGEFPGSPDDDWSPIPIEQVVKSLAVSRGVATARVPVAPEHLHGDAAFCKGEIDVVSANGLLAGGAFGIESNAARHAEQDREEISLRRGLRGRVDFAGHGDLVTMLIALRDATDGGVGSFREFKAGLRSRSLSPVECGVGPATDFDPGPDEPRSDPGPGDAERLRECQLRFPGKVSVCQILNVDRFHYSGPVYDIETLTSLYLIGNGIVSSNCNCTIVEVLDTDELPEWANTLVQPKPEEVDIEGPSPEPTIPRGAPLRADRVLLRSNNP